MTIVLHICCPLRIKPSMRRRGNWSPTNCVHCVQCHVRIALCSVKSVLSLFALRSVKCVLSLFALCAVSSVYCHFLHCVQCQ